MSSINKASLTRDYPIALGTAAILTPSCLPQIRNPAIG